MSEDVNISFQVLFLNDLLINNAIDRSLYDMAFKKIMEHKNNNSDRELALPISA